MANHVPYLSAEEKSPGMEEHLEQVLSTLAPREEMILRMRFGIGQRASTLKELSWQFSLTCERIRQIELKALRKVRERTRLLYSSTSFAKFRSDNDINQR